jgi:type II secretory pathway pseudopilin PulG
MKNLFYLEKMLPHPDRRAFPMIMSGLTILAALLFCLRAAADDPKTILTNTLAVSEAHYEGELSADEACFTLNLAAAADGESSMVLLAGDIALLPSKLPAGLAIVRENDRYLLVASRAGRFNFKLSVIAKIQREEPWNRISFIGPAATIASVSAQASGTDTDVQLLNGTLLEAVKTNGLSRVTGFLGADQTVALRWQARVAEVSHAVLLTVDSSFETHLTPTVVKYTGHLHYTVLQGNTSEITLTLPAGQTLTHLDGEQIRDWHLTTSGDRQTLTIELVKPVDTAYDLALYSEEMVAGPDSHALLNPPQPLNVERESGTLTISSEDILADIDASAGLYQVNAPDGAVAAYQFNARPFTLSLSLKPVEPVIYVTDRIDARLEEARLLVSHGLALDVQKAGIYVLELTRPDGFAVADVRGDGIEDWNVTDGKLCVNFTARVLGARRIEVQLEQSLKIFPDKIIITPLRVARASRESALIGAASLPGIQLRTGRLSGLREIPVNRLPDHADEILAYAAEQPDWELSVATERLTARVAADVFNLVTVGDGQVGGSATIRYGLVNQGVQEFKVRVPAAFKNVEFTGPNIRRKEQSGEIWTIGLQDKVWGGYTLVVTYDYSFDPNGASLAPGGVHAVGVERETGSVAITTASSLQLVPKSPGTSLRRIDESELAPADRSFITRTVALAYQYSGEASDLSVQVNQFAELPVLEAVADRTQITSVLTDSGEMLTQASFMVKNNEKQFQQFELPPHSKLWGCYVNSQPVKPERDGECVLVSLPRDTDRGQSFTVDILYAQTNGALASTFGKTLAFDAPRTDVPNTYAEWQLFVPPTLRLSGFGGSMNVAQGTTYELFDAWGKFLTFYGQVLHEAGGAILAVGFLAFLVIALVISAARRGWNGVLTLVAVMAILAILGAMLLPALSSAKRKAQSISSINNLKEVGLAARIFSGDNNNRLPQSFDEMKDELGSDKITYDTETGQRFTYLGGGMLFDSLKPDSVLAFSPIVNGHCAVLYADGSVAQMDAGQFAELSQRGLVQLANPRNNPVAQASADSGTIYASGSDHRVYAPASPSSSGVASIGSPNGTAAAGELTAPTPAPTAAGIRSIRIELPESGQPFLFTKVLNIRDEPLSIRAHFMPLQTFQTIQMTWQTAVFLVGLIVWWLQWRRPRRNSLFLTMALALMLGSVCSLLVQWRALHDALIIGFPVLSLAIIAILIWKYWPRDHRARSSSDQIPKMEPPIPGPAFPSAVTAILLLGLSFNVARAAAAGSADQRMALTHAAIVAARYQVTVNDNVAAVDATLQLSPAEDGQTIQLFGDDVAVERYIVQSGRAQLIRDGGSLSIKVGRRETLVEITLLVKISGDVTKRQLGFGIPPALSSQMSFTLDEPEAEVDFPAAISFRRTLEKSATRIDAVVGSAGRIEMSWTPRLQRSGEIATTAFCQDAALVSFGGGVMNLRTFLDYQISQGELSQARVLLPADQRLLRVEGEGIRTWAIENGHDGQVLTVSLLKGFSTSWRLLVETEKSLETLPASLRIDLPRALDIKRETGLIALRGSEELGVSVESSDGLQRVDADAFKSVFPGGPEGLSGVFQFATKNFSLRSRVVPIQPEIEAVVRNDFQVSSERLSLLATIDYSIEHAGLFSLKVLLPGGYRVEQADGAGIQQQSERVEQGGHILEITLKDRTIGAYSLNLELTRDYQQLPESLDIAGVHPLDTTKLTGFVAVTSEPGVSLKTRSFDGLEEIPALNLPDYPLLAGAGGVLAYKFISPNPGNAPEWNLSLATETVSAWVRAEIVNTLSLSESLLTGRALVRYEIANAPVKTLLIRVPDVFRNVEITGPNIRNRELAGNIWRVDLQNPTLGSYTLNVTWEQSSPLTTNTFVISGVTAEGAESEAGVLAIAAKASLQVSEADAAGLQCVDASDFPDWAGTPDPATALVYHYVRPGYHLALNLRRLGEAEVLQAIVEQARLTSVIADDGQMMTEMSLSLRSNGRQFLQLELPAGDKVWSAFVAGQAVRPCVRDGKLLLPVESSTSGEGSTPVELTYVGSAPFPRVRGNVGFVSPKFDVPLKSASWEIYLPPDYNYQSFQGTMTRDLSPAPESATSSFSILDYSSMEQAKKSAEKSEALRDVTEARRQLASGNMREAGASLNRARLKLAASDHASDDVKQLQKDLQAAQASNLVAAQSDFTFRNSAQSGAGVNGLEPVQLGLQYDSAEAGEQWDKLQRAQEIASAKVLPLHVNLPVRGQRFVFLQILQTETDKPLTIQLFAANVKALSWPSRILKSVCAFLLLWGVVLALIRLTSSVKE